MEQSSKYMKIPPWEKKNLSRDLAGLLFLHRYAKISDGNSFKTEVIMQWCEYNNPLSDDVMHAWLGWKNYIAGKKDDTSHLWLTWYHLELKRIFKHVIGFCCLDSVKDASSIYLNAVKQLYQKTSRYDQNESCRLTRSDWQKLENATITLLLREWLERHPKMRQTRYDFAKAPFGDTIPQDLLESADRNGNTILEKRRRLLYNAHKEICIMNGMGKIQQEQETINGAQHENKIASSSLIPYTQLCAMGFIAGCNADNQITEENIAPNSAPDRDSSCFRIFKYISQRKEIFCTPSDRQSYTKIANACKDYTAVLDSIAQWGQISDTGKIKDPKRYVIGSMMVMELEEAYCLHLASAAASVPLSKKRKGRICDSEYLESKIANCIYGRIPYTILPVYMQNRNNGVWKIYSISARNVLNYSTDLKYIYTAPLVESELYIYKTTILRMEQIELLCLLLSIFQDQINQASSNLDFECIADFLYREYNVIDSLRMIEFPSAEESNKSQDKCKKHYSQMQKFYEKIQSWNFDGSNQAFIDYRRTVNTQKNK